MVRLLLLSLALASLSPASMLTFTVDTPTELRGNFTAIGPTGGSVELTTNFNAFPDISQTVRTRRQYTIGNIVSLGIMVSGFPGVPDDPNFDTGPIPGLNPQTFPAIAGSFTNHLGTTTTFSYFGLEDSGNSGGTFMGSFEFSTTLPPPGPSVPEPSSLILLGAALAILGRLGALRRRKGSPA